MRRFRDNPPNLDKIAQHAARDQQYDCDTCQDTGFVSTEQDAEGVYGPDKPPVAATRRCACRSRRKRPVPLPDEEIPI